jgi:small-conductance mechanosensitive channel
MTSEQWIWAAVALASGLMLGELGGRLVRAARGSDGRPARVRAGARAMGNFVFWTSTAIGLLIAVAILDSDELTDLGDTLGENVPRFLLALVMLIVGYGVAVAVAAAVGQSAKRASGVRQRNLERFLRVLIMIAATAVALTQVGVGSTTLAVLLAVLVGAPALALALLSALGGRDVAGHLAAGRALRHQLREGWTLTCRTAEDQTVVGRIVEVHPTAVEVELPDGARLMVPNRQLLDAPFSVRP